MHLDFYFENWNCLGYTKVSQTFSFLSMCQEQTRMTVDMQTPGAVDPQFPPWKAVDNLGAWVVAGLSGELWGLP